MKKWLILLLFLFAPICASAELSSNLNIRNTMLKSNPKLVEYATYVDNDGNIVVPVDKGYATVKYTYGAFRVTVKEEYLDENGELVNGVDGYAFIKRKYRDRKLLEAGYYDVNGNLVTGPDGYARQELQYEGNHLISTWNYDPEGNPVGTHRILEYKKHDKAFLVTSDTWYDTEGQLAHGPNGYARVEYEYNARNKTRVAYISPDGSPFFYKKDGYATMVSEYNYDKILSTYYYGSDNELIAGKAGYAYVIYTYTNDYKTEMYYNADGTPYFNKNGVCGVCKKTGRRGRIVEEYYYVGEGLRGRIIDGYAKVKRTYDTYGKVIIESYYDENDQPMMVELLGYARVKNHYYPITLSGRNTTTPKKNQFALRPVSQSSNIRLKTR